MDSNQQFEWPKKTKDIFNHHMDSTVWDDFKVRDDDIVIATYAKSGTTWAQQIVTQILFDGAEVLPALLPELSPWLDLHFPPREEKFKALEGQQHRRVIKTHLPVDALVFHPQVKYIYLVRDGRDVVLSLHNHHKNFKPHVYDMFNSAPWVGPDQRLGPPTESVQQYFDEWLEKDGHPFWAFWENILSWWNIRHLPNVLLVHYESLLKNFRGEAEKMAKFLGVPVKEETWAVIELHCSFDYMKKNAEAVVPLSGGAWNGGAKTFINQGKNKRWQELLSPQSVAKYEQLAVQKLGKECAHYLATGELI